MIPKVIGECTALKVASFQSLGLPKGIWRLGPAFWNRPHFLVVMVMNLVLEPFVLWRGEC